MKAAVYIGDPKERKKSPRAKVDAWLVQVKGMVEQARGDYPHLNDHTLADVKLARREGECRVTLVFRKGVQ